MALNLKKMIEEIGEYVYTWRYPPPATHKGGSYVNRYVEASRVSPYAAGHIDAFVWPLFVIETVILGVMLL